MIIAIRGYVMRIRNLRHYFTGCNKIHDVDAPVDLRPQEEVKFVSVGQDGAFLFAEDDKFLASQNTSTDDNAFFKQNATPEAQMLLSLLMSAQAGFEGHYEALIYRKYENSSKMRSAYSKLYESVRALERAMPCPAVAKIKEQIFLVGFRCEVDELAMDMRHHTEADMSYLMSQKKKISRWAASMASSLTKGAVRQQLDLQLASFEDSKRVSNEWRNFCKMTKALHKALNPREVNAALGRSRLTSTPPAKMADSDSAVNAPMRLRQ
jgi:hypothetical protein